MAYRVTVFPLMCMASILQFCITIYSTGDNGRFGSGCRLYGNIVILYFVCTVLVHCTIIVLWLQIKFSAAKTNFGVYTTNCKPVGLG